MDEINISVDEILAELEYQRDKQQRVEPVSDMKRVNDIVEQLLIEKKTAQLQKEMTRQELDSFSREIKAQTRSITKQYEKFVKETTKQLKRQQREERVVARELNVDGQRERLFEETMKKAKRVSPSLRLARVASHQQVKVKTSLEKMMPQMKEKQLKFDLLKQSAHTDHIKREMANITSHFGKVRMEDASAEEGFNRSEITPSTYKEFKKNRNKKIGEFSLNASQKPTEHKSMQEDQELKPIKKNSNQMFIIDEERLASTSAFDEVTESIPIDEPIAEEMIVNKEIVMEQSAPLPQKEPIVLDIPLEQEADASNSTAFEVSQASIPKAKKAEEAPTPLAEELPYEEWEREEEYIDASQKESKMSFLLHEKKMATISTYVLAILAINAIVLSFVGIKDGTLQLFNAIAVSPMVYAILNMLLLIVATAFSYRIFTNAIETFTIRKPSKDVLYAITITIAFVVNLLLMFRYDKLLVSGIHLYTPIVIISLLCNFIGKRMMLGRICDNFEYITTLDKPIHAVSLVRNYKVTSDMAKGVLNEEPMIAKDVATDFPENFFKHSFQSDTSDELGMKLSVISLPIAMAVSVLAYFVYKDIYISLSVLSGVMIVMTTFIGGLIVAFPLHDTAGVTTHFGEMTPTVGAIEKLEDTNALLLDAYDLFPADTVILHGIKTFSGKRIDDAIVDAASVVCQSRSILANVFLNIIANNVSLLRKVDTIIYEDLMGISAWVADRRVLIGNRDLMINHSVPVPKQEYEEKYHKIGQDIIYLSTEGELSAAFIVQIVPKKKIFDAISLLEHNNVKAVVKTVDSVLTVQKLADIFHMDKGNIKVLPSRLHKAYNDEIMPREREDGALLTNGNFLGYLISAIATKKLSYCIKVGRTFNLVSVIIGLIALLALLLLGKFHLLSCLVMLGGMTLFGLIYVIYQKNIHL